VLASSESVRDASEQVAESIQKISDDAYEQKDRLQGVSENLDDLVATLERFQAENPSVDMGDSIDQFRQVATTMQQAAETSERMMAESENVAGAAEEQAAGSERGLLASGEAQALRTPARGHPEPLRNRGRTRVRLLRRSVPGDAGRRRRLIDRRGFIVRNRWGHRAAEAFRAPLFQFHGDDRRSGIACAGSTGSGVVSAGYLCPLEP